MDASQIRKKFGADYIVDEQTYAMGVHHLLSEFIAKRFISHNVVLDTNAGAGSTAIALAKVVSKVITVDLDESHLQQARQNAKLAGVAEKIEFIHADVTSILKKNELKLDAALLDPDWSAFGNKKQNHVTNLEDMQPSGRLLFNLVNKHTDNICFRLPKEIDKHALDSLPSHELEPILLNHKIKFYCAWFGDLRTKV